MCSSYYSVNEIWFGLHRTWLGHKIPSFVHGDQFTVYAKITLILWFPVDWLLWLSVISWHTAVVFFYFCLRIFFQFYRIFNSLRYLVTANNRDYNNIKRWHNTYVIVLFWYRLDPFLLRRLLLCVCRTLSFFPVLSRLRLVVPVVLFVPCCKWFLLGNFFIFDW